MNLDTLPLGLDDKRIRPVVKMIDINPCDRLPDLQQTQRIRRAT